MNAMSHTSFPAGAPERQRGAALVIGLILLLVLTVLAISGVNSASLEFFMAGNEQFRQNAFQAAETGIERALVNGQFVVAGAATATEIGTSVRRASSDSRADCASCHPRWKGSMRISGTAMTLAHASTAGCDSESRTRSPSGCPGSAA